MSQDKKFIPALLMLLVMLISTFGIFVSMIERNASDCMMFMFTFILASVINIVIVKTSK
jgi:uncharacterized membrane protein